MAEERQFDEPDFRKHLRQVLEDLHNCQIDGVDEAYEAITEHPGFQTPESMVAIKRLR